MVNINLLYYLIAGGIFGALALKTGIPAAPLAGALLGASIVSVSGKIPIADWPSGTRTLLEIGIGTVIGTSLTKDSIGDLQNLWKPAILITFTLVATGLVIGLWTSRLLKVDIITTILGAAPGGISGMSLVGSEYINKLVSEFDLDGISDRQLVYKRTIDFVDSRFNFLYEELNEIENTPPKFFSSK